MFKEQMNKIKSLIIKDGYEERTNDKRKIENLVFFLIILIVTIIAINTIIKGNKKEKNESIESSYKQLAVEDKKENNMSDELEKKIEKILETMYGVR